MLNMMNVGENIIQYIQLFMNDGLLTSLLKWDGTSGMSLFEVPSCRKRYKGNSENGLS